MRGRNDTLSTKFKVKTFETLEDYSALNEIDLVVLEERLRANGVNNSGDRRMVRESIEFARSDLGDYGSNLFAWTVELIRSGAINQANDALTAIHEIADKLSTFYMRDVVLVEGAESVLTQADYAYLQPVDTWVKRVAAQLEIIDSDKLGGRWDMKDKIIRRCLASPARHYTSPPAEGRDEYSRTGS